MGGLIGVWRGGVEHSHHCDLQVRKGGVVCMTSQRFMASTVIAAPSLGAMQSSSDYRRVIS